MDDIERIWEKMLEETAKAFRAFKYYRDMGPRRTVAKAMEETKDMEGEAINTGALVWSVKYNWVARCKAYDKYLDQVETQERCEAIKKMIDRHAKIAEGFMSKIITRLKAVDPDTLTNSQLIRWFEASAKIERLSRGEPTEISLNENNNIDQSMDLSKLSDDEFITFRSLFNKTNSADKNETGIDKEEEE